MLKARAEGSKRAERCLAASQCAVLTSEALKGRSVLLKVFWGDAVHPVLELVDDLVFRGFLHRLLEDDGCLLDHLVRGVDLRACAHGERYGVGWSRVDLDGAAADLEAYGREESRVPQLGHGDLLHRAAELCNQVDGKIVGKGPAELLVLELHQDRARLWLADPDRQVTVIVLYLEDDYGAGGKEIQVDPVDGHPGEAVGAHRLYAPLTTRSREDHLTPCRFYFPPRWSAISLSATPPCCTLSRR